jgi:hypothetical protein
MMIPYRRACLLSAFVIAAAIAVACNQPQGATIAQALYLGQTMFGAHVWHGLPGVLGGKTFSAPTSISINEGWLGALGMYILYPGSASIYFTSVLLAATALILVERRCRQRGLGDGVTAFALGIAFMCSLGELRVGGGLLDLAFTAAFFLVIERAPRKSAWWIIPITLIWCNASIYGFIAPLWSGLAAAGRSFGPTRADRLRRAAFYLAPAFVCLSAPATIRIFTHYIAYLHLDPTLELQEWRAVDVSALSFYGGFVPALIVAACCGLRRAGISDSVTAIGAILFALIHARYLGAAGIVLGPIAATAWAKVGEEKGRERMAPRDAWHSALVVASITFIAAAFVGVYADVDKIALISSKGEHEIDQLVRDGRPHRLFCVNASWCNYAVLVGSSNVRVFMDGRLGYPKQVIDDMQTFVFVEKGWHKKFDAQQITDVLSPGTRLASLLALLPDWNCASSPEKIWACERKADFK